MTTESRQLQQVAQTAVAAVLFEHAGPVGVEGLMAAAARAVAACPPARRAAHARLVAAQTAGAYMAWFDGRAAGWWLSAAPGGAAGQPPVVWQADDGVVCDVISPQRAGRQLVDAETGRLVQAHLAAAGEAGVGAVVGCRLVAPLAPAASQLLDEACGGGRWLAATRWWVGPVRPGAQREPEVGA